MGIEFFVFTNFTALEKCYLKPIPIAKRVALKRKDE